MFSMLPMLNYALCMAWRCVALRCVALWWMCRNYDVEEYELQLSVPTSVWIRSYSMWHHLHKEFPDAVGSFRRVLDVKTVLKVRLPFLSCVRRGRRLTFL